MQCIFQKKDSIQTKSRFLQSFEESNESIRGNSIYNYQKINLLVGFFVVQIDKVANYIIVNGIVRIFQ